MARAIRDGGTPPRHDDSELALAPNGLPTPWTVRPGVWLLGILALTFALYLPSLANGFTNWDDNIYVTHDPLVVAPTWRGILTTPVNGHWSPLTIASFALNHAIGGFDPFGYHLLNLLLHLANTALVFVFVRRLSGGRFATTLLTTLLFALHPTHVESVAWVAERKDVLYALFYLAALLVYLEHVAAPRARTWAATFGLFVLSVASKPAAVVLPLSLLAIDVFRHRPLRAGVVLEKLPFFAVAVAIGLLTVHGQATLGALDRMKHFGTFERLTFAGYSLVMEAVRLIAPFGLSAVYPLPVTADGALSWRLIECAALAATGIPLAFVLTRRQPAARFGLAFFLINIVLVLQFVPVGQVALADRFTYVPYIGLGLALAWRLDDPIGTAAPPAVRRLIASAWLVLLGVCGFQTWSRCHVWKDSETLWSDVIRSHPHRITVAYANRGADRALHGQPRAALADYDEALALSPEQGMLWTGRGNALLDLGRPDAARSSYDRALTLQTPTPFVLERRAQARLQLGDTRGAIDDLSRALALQPNARALEERGVAWARLGDDARAAADWQEALTRAPSAPDTAALRQAIEAAHRRAAAGHRTSD